METATKLLSQECRVSAFVGNPSSKKTLLLRDCIIEEIPDFFQIEDSSSGECFYHTVTDCN